jgi:DNA ligase-1
MYSSVIAALAATSSRLEKEKILSEYKTDEVFKEILSYTYDSFKMFGVKQIADPDPFTENMTVQECWGEIKPVLDRLLSRELSGNRAQAEIKSLMSMLSTDEATLLGNIIKKDLRCGVSDKTVNKIFPKLIPTFELMLAAQEKDSKVKLPSFLEVKKDGLRCAALYNGDEVTFLSRSGKPFETVGFFANEVIAFLGGKPGMLDGELMGDNFNETVSGVKRDVENELTSKIKYTVYDHLTFDEWTDKKCSRKRTERIETLEQMLSDAGDLNHINLIEYCIVNTKEEVLAKFREYRSRGEEGAILKDFDNVYEFKRSRTISKMKPSETMDLEIIGFEEGSGKYEGMLGALVVDYKGKKCRIGTGFKDEDRRNLWDMRAVVLGQLCECTFMEETSSIKEGSDAGGSTRHAVYHGLRSFKGDKV